MATKKKGKLSVTIQGRFTPGEKVHLHLARSDSFNPGQLGPRLASRTAGDDGTTFDGLDADRYWAVSDDGTRHAMVTAKPIRTEKPPPASGLPAAPLASPAPGVRTDHKVIVGALGTGNRVDISHVDLATGNDGGSTFAGAEAGVATPKKDQADEPQPHPRQEDVSGAQRSNTLTGSAHPVDVKDRVPKASQEDHREGRIKGVQKDGPQRSRTELGEATPKDRGELVPASPQELSEGAQRSNTDTGQEEPKPRSKSPRKQQQARDSSASKAKGSGTTAKAGTSKTKKNTAKAVAQPQKKAAPKRSKPRSRSGR